MARRGNGDVVVSAVAVSILLLIHCFTVVYSAPSSDPKSRKGIVDDDGEDLSFLEEPVDSSSHHHPGADSDAEDGDDESSSADGHDSVDEKDVVVLSAANFTEFISKSKNVMVEFYASWCGHCQALAPEYAQAATDLKDQSVDVSLAKLEASEEEDLSQKYNIQGYPTVLFFTDGDYMTYPGDRTKEAIITWIKKKTGPGIYNITTVEEAQTILTSQKKVVLGFLDSLVGSESQELASASKLEDDVAFYQTVNPDVAKLFNIDPKSKLPSLVLLKKETEKVSYFDGSFTKSAIVEFVVSNKFPLVTYLTDETSSLIFENPIKNQLLLFATSNHYGKVIPLFEEAAKSFKGKLLFIFVEADNEDVGVPVGNFFGVTGDKPMVLAYTGNEDGKKHIFEGELTVENIKVFGDDFLQDKLIPFYKSDPIPEANDGDVKVVVGHNFDEIVLDESKDVLLEIYAPWCGHCQSLEPVYNKLAKHLNGIESLVIAKMDGTTNEHPRAKADGFPTLLFFPAGNKSFEPISVESERTVVEFYKFIKKHASIPFKLHKPASAGKSERTDAAPVPSPESKQSFKDEL